ncbi:inorganic phosphate transporter [Lacrimispora sp.]|uniref:inorganic phosphate transporter n=1 Tax=Lacrimispora sp. TaxID=2719234 RepID=UPI0028A9C442|nr:inorganic phosphate transporter [Lacrimispora sp.]
MSITLGEFIVELTKNLPLAIVTILTLGVILVNGWTDAPNAIATCISTRSMRPRTAILMAAVMNFIGILVMTSFNSTVAMTIYNMVDFGQGSNQAGDALVALCAALAAIVLWAVLAWKFGIPTSESHALIAGLSGSAIALHGSLSGVNGSEWMKVLYGLVASAVLGFSLGWIMTKLTERLCRNVDRGAAQPYFKGAQIAGAAAMAFMHGAQDGQKFMSVFLLGTFLARGNGGESAFAVPFWLMVLCAVVMGLGTSIGGMRIIKTVGMSMVKLEKYQGFSADIAAATCLMVSTLTGMPVSTTHTKTTAMMGVGASKRISAVNWGVAREMALAWILTFPGCGLVGFLMTHLFLRIF